MASYSAGNKEGWCIILQGIRRDGVLFCRE